MIDITQLKSYSDEIKTAISAIKTVKVVVDESQLVDKIRSLKSEDNQILMTVIPEYDTSGSSDLDNVSHNNYLAFLVLEKVNYKALTDGQELDVWQRTLQSIKLLEQKLLMDASTGNGTCPAFAHLDVRSLRIEPVWKLAECNGYILTLMIKK